MHINIPKGLLFLSDFFEANRPIPVYDIKNVTDTPPNPPVFKGNIPSPSGGRSHDLTADTARVYDASTEKGLTITDYTYLSGTFTLGTQYNHFYNNRRGKNPNDFSSPTINPIGHDAVPSTNGNYLFSADERGGGDIAEGSATRQMAAYLKIWDIDTLDIPPVNGYRYPIRKVYEVRECPTCSPNGSFANSYFTDLVTGEFSNSIHNVHIRNEGGSDVAYISYYTKGLRILNVANPLSPTELGYYDTPAVANYINPVYNGSWGVYPHFNSGTILVSDMRGLHVFRRATEVSGTISANTTWSGARFITGNITVQNNATLTIAAGTTVAFANGTNLTVNAGSKILANGTATQRIKFTANTSPAGRSQYGTIFLYGSGNQFQYCTVEYSDWGLKFVGPASGNVVSNCTFRQNDQAIRIHYN
ncbi:MAG: LVIVD repeat-containing protein, partial [bacterium]